MQFGVTVPEGYRGPPGEPDRPQGISVRQGKRFELEVDGELTDSRLDDIRRAAETLLANTVIETFAVRVEGGEPTAR